jgi:hypothetical protein
LPEAGAKRKPRSRQDFLLTEHLALSSFTIDNC